MGLQSLAISFLQFVLLTVLLIVLLIIVLNVLLTSVDCFVDFSNSVDCSVAAT